MRPNCAPGCRSCRRSSACARRSMRWSPRPTSSPASPRPSRPTARRSATRSGASPSLPTAVRPSRRCATSMRSSTASSERLADGLVERLQQERDVSRRAAMFGFLQEFGALKGLLGGVPRPRLRSGRPAAGARQPARRLLHQRHAGRHADRPHARPAVALVRPAGPSGRARAAARQELLPAPPAAGGGVRRGAPGLLQRAGRAAPTPAAQRGLRGGRSSSPWRCSPAGRRAICAMPRSPTRWRSGCRRCNARSMRCRRRPAATCCRWCRCSPPSSRRRGRTARRPTRRRRCCRRSASTRATSSTPRPSRDTATCCAMRSRRASHAGSRSGCGRAARTTWSRPTRR